MCRGIDVCKHIEGEGSLQLIKGPSDKLLPALVKGLGGVGLHAPATDQGRSKALTGSLRDRG